jgi:formylglycine-generating enzyme required for sulfatase activity
MAAFGACGGPSTSDKASVEAGPPRSCEAMGAVMGVAGCGPAGESCCTSLAVAGGTFLRSYDGVTYTDKSAPATVSSFQLDKYEVTVGRFRPFVAAVVRGWAPSSGAGKHAHLSGGGVNGGTETGWDASWTALLGTTPAQWTTSLQCGYPYGTWTVSAGANESLPINCETWYEAYAFCIWDGGFLPTEAEWNYAAAGGNDQRVYPWSDPSSSMTADYTYASYDCLGDTCSFQDILAVGSDPTGNGKWGQADLGGNVAEWNLDVQAPYATPCTDCANLAAGPNRTIRGGGFTSDLTSVLASGRDANTPATRNEIYGVRCARAP